MPSKAAGKTMVYVAQETKGTLIQLIHKMPEADKEKFMEESGLRFVTYDQAIRWLLAHRS